MKYIVYNYSVIPLLSIYIYIYIYIYICVCVCVCSFFHIQTVRLDSIKDVYSPTDALVSCLKNNIKIYIKTAPTCFGVTVTPSSGSALIRAY